MKCFCFAIACGFAIGLGTMSAQPVITSVTNESGESWLCPGGVAFINGTGLGGSKGIAVTAGGKQAYVINALGTALQVQLPVDAPQGDTTLTAGSSAPFKITLGQYCPGLPSTSSGGVAYVYALHDSGLGAVTPAFPAIPDELVDITVTGLGPTTPPYGTGTSPPDASANTNTLPTVKIGGQDAKVIRAFLIPNDPGFYYVVARTPAAISSGNQDVTVTIGGLTSNAAKLPLTTGGAVALVANAASQINSALPNGAVAQGSIAIAKGKNLGPDPIVIDPAPFQHTTVGGTSVAITVGGTTVAAPLYYASFGQIAFLVPSGTPAGAGTIAVTYAGQPGAQAPITVVPSNAGIFTATSDGQGAGLLTYNDYSLVSATKGANCGGPFTTCGAANTGDILTIWATGLGPVSGNELGGAGLGVNMTQLPLTLWLGGVAVKPFYQGRSGSVIGEDQIAFTVPPDAPLGCDVPLSIQIGDVIGNSVAVPIAAAGSRTCTPTSTDTLLPQGIVVPLSTGSAAFNYGQLRLRRRDQNPGFKDNFRSAFFRFTVPAGVRPFFLSYVDPPAPGTCQIYNNPNGQGTPPFAVAGTLDAGPQLTLTGPNGVKTVAGDGHGNYNATLSGNGTYLSAGNYTISGPGGADVPAFSTQIAIPTMPVMTSPTPDAPNPAQVTRANGLTVTWTGGQAGAYVAVEGFSATDGSGNIGAMFSCTARADAGTFTVPPNVLMALPAGSNGAVMLTAFATPVSVAGTGLDLLFASASYDYFASATYK